MVLQVMKWNIIPDKTNAYAKWAETAIKRSLTAGVVQFQAYRPITGNSEVVVTYEFADLAAWTNWRRNENVHKVIDELRKYTFNVSIEVWGPSPIVPAPVQFY